MHHISLDSLVESSSQLQPALASSMTAIVKELDDVLASRAQQSPLVVAPLVAPAFKSQSLVTLFLRISASALV